MATLPPQQPDGVQRLNRAEARQPREAAAEQRVEGAGASQPSLARTRAGAGQEEGRRRKERRRRRREEDERGKKEKGR